MARVRAGFSAPPAAPLAWASARPHVQSLHAFLGAAAVPGPHSVCPGRRRMGQGERRRGACVEWGGWV